MATTPPPDIIEPGSPPEQPPMEPGIDTPDVAPVGPDIDEPDTAPQETPFREPDEFPPEGPGQDAPAPNPLRTPPPPG